MNEFWARLQGKKIYILMWMWIGMTFIEKVVGWDIPNFDPGPDWVNDIMIALGIGAGRSAVAKLGTEKETANG